MASAIQIRKAACGKRLLYGRNERNIIAGRRDSRGIAQLLPRPAIQARAIAGVGFLNRFGGTAERNEAAIQAGLTGNRAIGFALR